jgi:hypothetical protein
MRDAKKPEDVKVLSFRKLERNAKGSWPRSSLSILASILSLPPRPAHSMRSYETVVAAREGHEMGQGLRTAIALETADEL